MKHAGQRGTTLLETCIACIIGLACLNAAWLGFSTMQNTQRAMVAQAQLQHEGRYALELMRQHIALAGYTAWEHTSLRNNRPSRSLQGDAHSLRLQYHNVRRDCLSERSSAAVVDMRFYLAQADVKQLYCQSLLDSSLQAQPIARGVEELSFRYLVAGQWLSAPPGAGSSVQAVEICLVLAADDSPHAHNAAWQALRPTCARPHLQARAQQYAADLPRARGDQRRWLRISTLVATPNLSALAWSP